MLGSEKGKSPSQRATTSPESSQVASGIGYAYNLPPVPPQNMLPPPWIPPYGPGSHPPLHFTTDSNDSEGFLAHMASLGIPPQGHHDQTPPPGCSSSITKVEPGAEIDTRAASPPPTRERFSYTRYQVELLNGIFIKIRYPNSMQKQLIAKRVGIKRDQVKIWFQNRRRKDVVGKTTAKDDDSERKMVKDDVLESVVKELESYADDPKGRKIKEAVRPSEKKAKRRPARNSSPRSDELNQSKSPVHIAPALDKLDTVISEPYQPNCMAFPQHPAPSMLMPLPDSASSLPLMPLPSHDTYPTPPGMKTSAPNKACVPFPKTTTMSPRSPNDNVTPPKCDSLLSSVLESVPAPVVGQSTAKPVESSPKSPSNYTETKPENSDSENSTDSSKISILTELTPVDESSNDSHFSAVSAASPVSDVASEDSLHDSSGSKSALHIDLGLNNDVNTSSGSLKRPRSDDSEEEDEPPRKRQEIVPENKDGIVPPNKVAPPSEPLKFDFTLMRPQIPNQILPPMPCNIPSQDPDKRPTSPILLGPPQPWTGWPGVPNPGIRPPAETDMGQFNPYMPPLPMPNPHLKSPCGPELPWPPLRDMYPFPPNFSQPPWDLALPDTGLDPKNAAMADHGYFPPDPFKPMMFNGNTDDGAKTGQVPLHRPEPMHSWMLPPYPNPYTNFGPPPINGTGDKILKV